ncbi:MAG: hypothetical protein K2N35_04460 [Muribaculaceae bacterium]|nr:hypothetical protein [Muribaculaceae bacterium]
MKRKKYEVSGMMEWHPEFKVGRTRLQVSFTGGHLCNGGNTPASYETSDPVVQAVIERSAAFRSGKIRVGKEVDISDSEVDAFDSAESKEESQVAEKGFVFEYSDINEVYSFLEDMKGVPAARLCTPESYAVEAKKLGIILKKKEK